MFLNYIMIMKYTKYFGFFAVDGGWGKWSDWAECPVTCGGGQHERIRSYDSPPAQHGGAKCMADGSCDTECEECNLDPSPSMCEMFIPFSDTSLIQVN